MARLLDGLRGWHSSRMEPASKFDEICARIAATDPLIIDAIDDVDLGLLAWSISLTPRERLRAVSSAARTLSRFRRVAPSARRLRNRD